MVKTLLTYNQMVATLLTLRMKVAIRLLAVLFAYHSEACLPHAVPAALCAGASLPPALPQLVAGASLHPAELRVSPCTLCSDFSASNTSVPCCWGLSATSSTTCRTSLPRAVLPPAVFLPVLAGVLRTVQ